MCAEGFNLGVYGGAGNALLTEYNDSIKEANDYNAELGISRGLNKLESAIMPEITVCYNFKIPPFYTGVYMKNFMAVLVDNSSVAEWKNGGRAQEIKADLSVFYTGAGGRLSLGREGGDSFIGFIGVDAGI